MDAVDYHIRSGEISDAVLLAEFGARVFDEVFGPDNDPVEMAAHLAKTFNAAQQSAELADAGITTLIVERDKSFIGYAQIRENHAPDNISLEHPIELWRFYIDAPWRGSGLAQKLMHAVWETVQRLGGGTLWLSVWEQNPRAIAFYKKFGFRDAGSLDFWLGDELQTDRLLIAEVDEAVKDE